MKVPLHGHRRVAVRIRRVVVARRCTQQHLRRVMVETPPRAGPSPPHGPARFLCAGPPLGRAVVEPGVGFASGDRHTDRIALHTPGPRLSDPYGGADNHVNLRDKLRGLLVRLYARRVEGHLDHAQVPKHIGVIMDGNRRWAKAAGSAYPF